jgi:hypothetical protein
MNFKNECHFSKKKIEQRLSYFDSKNGLFLKYYNVFCIKDKLEYMVAYVESKWLGAPIGNVMTYRTIEL